GHGLKEENKLRTAAGLSALWDGEPVRRVRAGDGAAVFPGRPVSGHLMVQPEVANILFTDALLLGQGLLSRVLVAAPESAAGTRNRKPEQATTGDALEACGKILLAALERSPPLRNDRANELIPRPLPLSEAARKAFFDYVAHIEDAIGLGCD